MAETKMPAAEWVRKGLSEHGPDLLQEMVAVFAQLLMSADVDGVYGASYGSRSSERVNRRNGYRQRDGDTRVGTISLAVPQVRESAYFPEFLLQPRRRAEKALVAAVAEAYVLGISIRKVDKLVKTMGLDGISKSRVSEMAKSLDESVDAFRNRTLDTGPYPFVWLDAMQIKSREGGRVVNVTAVMAIGVNGAGYREVLGVDVITSEDGAGWLAFLRSLVSRGLSGVELAISDAHEGLKGAIGAALPGSRLATAQDALHGEPAGQGAQGRATGRGHASVLDLRAARCREHPRSVRLGPRASRDTVPTGGRAARQCPRIALGVQCLPQARVAPDLV